MASILNLTFSNVFTKENNTIITIPLNIFHGPDKEKLVINKIHTHEMCKYLLKNKT